MDCNIISKLVIHIADSKKSVTLSCLEMIINILIEKSQTEEIAEILKENRLVPELFKVIDHPTEEIRTWCYSILCLFAIGTQYDVESIISNSDFVDKMKHAVSNEKKSRDMVALWLSNLIRYCSGDQIIQFLENGIYGCLIDLLDVEDEDVLERVLNGIDCGLKWGEKLDLNDENGRNKFLAELDNKGAIEKIKGLLENGVCCDEVEKIWEDYFDND